MTPADRPQLDGVPPTLPLSGVSVVEIGYGIAAPVATRNLAQLGADVVRVESARRPDSLRVSGAGWIPTSVDVSIRRDTMPSMNFSSTDKRSLACEIDAPEGRAVLERLVSACDVFVTNLSASALHKLELEERHLRNLRPDLVFVTMPAFASTGPYHSYRTWGHNLAAAAGIDHTIGWGDRESCQLGFAYPDFVSAHAATTAVMAALRRRRVTGEGATIEVRQFAMTLAAVGGELLAAQGGTAAEPDGNRDPAHVPSGIYPCRGPDRWVAISIESDDRWAALGLVAGLEHLALDPCFADAPARRDRYDDIDAAIAAWTSTRTDWEAASELQSAGVAACPVLDAWDVVADPQLAARDFFHALPHARFARDLVFGQAIKLSETPLRAERAAPAFGEHSREVLAELGCSDAEIEALVRDGIVGVVEHPDVTLERPYVHWLRKMQRLVDWGTPTFDPATEMMHDLEEPS